MAKITYIHDKQHIQNIFGNRLCQTKLEKQLNEFLNSDAPVAFLGWEEMGYSSCQSCSSTFTGAIKRLGMHNIACIVRNYQVYLVRKDKLDDILNVK